MGSLLLFILILFTNSLYGNPIDKHKILQIIKAAKLGKEVNLDAQTNTNIVVYTKRDNPKNMQKHVNVLKYGSLPSLNATTSILKRKNALNKNTTFIRVYQNNNTLQTQANHIKYY